METHDDQPEAPAEAEAVRIFERISLPVPEGATPGTKLLYDAPDGQELRLTVPEGVGPGSVMNLEQDPFSKVWRCMADPAKSQEPEPVSAAPEEADAARKYVEPFARVYPSGCETPRMPPANPVLEHQAVQRPVKLSTVPGTVLLPAGPAMAVPNKVPSFTPPPVAAFTPPPRPSWSPTPQAPSYGPPPPPTAAAGGGGAYPPSYTPPPQALPDQRPSYNPPPVVVLPAAGPVPAGMVAAPPGVVLARMPTETIQLGATYLLPSSTPPRMLGQTVSVAHHTQSAARLHSLPTVGGAPVPGAAPAAVPPAAAAGPAGGSIQIPPAGHGSIHVPPAGQSGAASVAPPQSAPPGFLGQSGAASVAPPQSAPPGFLGQSGAASVAPPQSPPPGFRGGLQSPMVQHRVVAGPPPRVAAVPAPCWQQPALQRACH